MKKSAQSLFHQPPQNLNCAQSVLAAYQQVTGDDTLDVATFQIHGGGRAPEGICGALYAACLLRPEAAETMKAAFKEKVGCLDCVSIKAAGVPSCEACVAIAAEILGQETCRWQVSDLEGLVGSRERRGSSVKTGSMITKPIL